MQFPPAATPIAAAALVCFISVVVFRFGLKGGVPETARQRPRWAELVVAGIRQARNPRILLAYFSAITSRGDMVVAGLFVSLWATMAVKQAGGEAAVAQYQVFLPFAVMQVCAVLWSFVFGSVLDRINRVFGMILALAFSVVAYGALYFVESPLDLRMLPVFALLGAAMASAIMSSMALVGQEAPPRERGAVIGLLSMFGSVGIIASAGVGGILFSAATPWAPFLLMAGAQAVLLVWALLVWILAPGGSRGPCPHRPPNDGHQVKPRETDDPAAVLPPAFYRRDCLFRRSSGSAGGPFLRDRGAGPYRLRERRVDCSSASAPWPRFYC